MIINPFVKTQAIIFLTSCVSFDYMIKKYSEL